MLYPRNTAFLAGAFTLIAAHAPAQEDQVGGWHRALWEGGQSSWDLQQVLEVPDMTGDGLADVVVLGGSILQVLDGTTGIAWYSYDQPSFGVDEISIEASDFDGDGLTDLVIGDREYEDPITGQAHMGRVLVIRGGDAQVHWEIVGAPNLRHFGDHLIVADFDADGIDDVMSYQIAWGEGHRTCVSGLTGAILWQVKDDFRAEMYLVDDLTQDGVPELFAANKGNTETLLVDGRDGSVVWSSDLGFEYAAKYASVVCTDANRDGVPDLIVCEPYAHKNERGRISVRDGISGQQLWHRKGNRRSDRFGDDVWLEDVDGDGVDELFSWGWDRYVGDPSTLQCFELSSGKTRWRHEFGGARQNGYVMHRVDLNLDGRPDFVLANYDMTLNRSTLRAVDADTGRDIWGQRLLIESFAILRLRELRTNQDAVPDLVLTAGSVAGQPGGSVVAVDGASGDQVWLHRFDPGTTRGGALETYLDPQGAWQVYFLQAPARTQGVEPSVVCLAGATGKELWRIRSDYDGEGRDELEIVDWNRDGVVELLRRPRAGADYYPVGFELFDPMLEMQRIWSTRDLRFSEDGDFKYWFGASIDRDGDGWLDPLLLGRVDGGRDRALAVSGRTGTRFAGIELDQDTLSAAQGGFFQLDIDAGLHRSGAYYQLLFSEQGAGRTTLQSLEVPLASSLWLTRSSIGIYPPRVFSEPTGVLDLEGKTTIGIDIPAGALVQWAGREIAFCVVTHRLTGDPPEWTTGAARLEVNP